MSTPARAARRRAERADRHRTWDGSVPDGYGVVAAWCATEDDHDEAKKGTHDALIRLMGDRRTGGVGWRITTGQDAVESLRVLREGATGALGDHYRQLSGLLREHGGFLVVALAPGRAAVERVLPDGDDD